MAQLEITLLGSLHIKLDGKPAAGFHYDKVRALLAYLAVERPRAHRRDELVGLFWPESPEEDARTSLRQALAHLRAAIGDTVSPQPFLLVTRESVQWNGESDADVDVVSFEEAMQAVRQHPHRSLLTCRSCMQRLARAIERYQGDFLAHFFLKDSAPFDEWAVVKRETLQREALEALDWLAAYHEGRGDYPKAEHYLRRQLSIEPWQEEAHRRLMRILALGDQRSAALSQYEACRKILQEAMGVEPQPETKALYEAIRTGEPAGEALAGYLNLAATRKHNLPPPLTPLIGRDQELAALHTLLSQPETRLVTLLGPGGVGKTRLALQVAADQVDNFAGGVFLVSLAGVNQVELLPAEIADALQLSLTGNEDPGQQLFNALADKEMLLILDNLEHLPDAGRWIRELLEHAPGVVILATSRASLKLSGERVFPLKGLPVVTSCDQTTEDGSAVDLFFQAARRRQPEFQFDNAGRKAAEEVCRLLEGLPLAVELAAAWAGVLSCEEIASEIQFNLDFLSADVRDIPARHSSMRAVFDHSWDLLSPSERAIFRKLSVFQSGFTREAAGQIAGAALTDLRSLADKSLVRRNLSGRYDLHDLARQYGFQKLAEAGEVELTRSRALESYTKLAEAAAPELEGEQGSAWMRHLEEEMKNLRDALDWSLESRQLELGMRLAWALFRFWYWHNQHVREARSWLERLLNAARSIRVDEALLGNVLYETGVMASMQRDIAAAEGYFTRSLEIRQSTGDKHGQAAVLNSLGTIAFEQEDYARARELFETSLAIRRELRQRPSVQLSNLGVVTQIQGDYRKAKEYFEESLQIDREDHNLGGIAIGLGSLARVVLHLGDEAQALGYFLESLKIRRDLGDQEGTAYALEGLATFNAGEGGVPKDARRAVRLFSAAQALRETIGVPLSADEVVENQPYLDRAKNILGEEGFQAAWSEGRQAPLKTVVETELAQIE